jgi:hypothetical protein
VNLRLTKPLLAATYDMLRESDPFRSWKLPPSSECRFKIVRSKKIFADFCVKGGVPVYRISAAKHGHTVTLLASMAHEMIHHRQALTGDREIHGPRFQKMAARACAVHGFDHKTF